MSPKKAKSPVRREPSGLPAPLAALLAETTELGYKEVGTVASGIKLEPHDVPRHDPATIAATLRVIALQSEHYAQGHNQLGDGVAAAVQIFYADNLRKWASLVEAEAARRQG